MIDDIPQELRNYAQWCVWRYESRDNKDTKVPYDAKSGELAAVDDPTTYSTFQEACTALATGQFSGLGFILTEFDPFSFIDLDIKDNTKPEDISRQVSIQEKFDTYSERSPGGKGLHIICMGHVPKGRRRSSIEVYSAARYMTVTGDVYDRKPIAERQNLLQILWNEMGKGTNIYTDDGNDAPQTMSDDEVTARGIRALNGALFLGLMRGEFGEQGYQSQSEADFALIDMIAFYTKNRDQIKRIFYSSGLGQRKKAQRVDYIETMVNRSFDRMLSDINFGSLKARMDRELTNGSNGASRTVGGEFVSPAATASPVLTDTTSEDWPSSEEAASGWESPPLIEPVPAPQSTVKLPPGLMGDIANFIYQSSNRPVPEISLAAAMGLMAGMCGRAFNTPTGLGLNLYLAMIAASGVGKEAMQNGIARLINEVSTFGQGKEAVVAIKEFLGPSDFRSDAGLIKALERQPSFVSIMGEFGHTLKQMHHEHAPAHLRSVLKVLLDAYAKSDYGGVLRPIVYSDAAKNTKDIYTPSLTILAESTPSAFYEVIDERMTHYGFLPRFVIIEYVGKRVNMNEGHQNLKPTPQLLARLADLAVKCLTLMQGNKTIRVTFADQHTYQYQRGFEQHCTDTLNSYDDGDPIRDLWNRVYANSLKLASLVAVGCDPVNPIISLDIFRWSQEVVESSLARLVGRFRKGEIGSSGTGEGKQHREVLRIMREFILAPWRDIAGYGIGSPAMQTSYIVPFSYMHRRLSSVAVFRNDPQRATPALYRTLKTLEQTGMIRNVTGKFDFDCSGGKGQLFMVIDSRVIKGDIE